MELISFILNLPWTIVMLAAGILSVPTKIQLHRKPFTIIIRVRSFWYYHWIPSKKGVRAMTLGSLVLLGPKLLNKDVEHELIHVEQHQREPFIHPILNLIETIKSGYRHNKYEEEAYTKTGSTYVGR
jgi:hypothetical protein